jgi:hypothetical protein
MSTAIANQLVLAYLGRPADTAWRTSTANLLNGNQPSAALQGAFYNAAVSEGVFSTTDSNSALVNKIFLQTFGFGASTFEQTAWSNLVTNGTITKEALSWTIFSSYLGATNVPAAYQTPAQSKLVAIDAYTNALATDAAANLQLSLGGGAATLARSYASGVTNQATAATAVSGASASVAQLNTATTGTTYTLTTGTDNVPGTSGNDAINGLIGTGATLTAADIINGGAGTDTLNVTYANAGGGVDGLAGAAISNVEFVNVRNTNATGGNIVSVAATGLSGVSASGAGDVTFTALANNASFTANGSSAGAILVGYVATATTANLAFTGATTTSVGVSGAALTTATITAGGTAANASGTITSTEATLKTFNIVASSNLTTAINTAGTTGTLNVSGTAASVNVGTLDTDFTTVNASGLTAGGLTATMSATATTKITGGAGNDIITTGVVLTTGFVDAGAGTGDRLIVADTTHLATAALGAKYTNFEQLQANNGAAGNNVAVDLDNISGITSIRLNDGTGTTEVSNLTATQAGAITVVAADATGAITIGVKGAAAAGQIDTVALTADDGVATTVSTVALGTPVMANVEKLSINAVDNVTIAALTGAASLDTITLTGAGTQNIITGANSVINFTINGSAATGALTLNATAYATNGVSLTGGSAADTLTGSLQNDALNGGAGNDTLSSLAGNDTINGGDGTDSINGGIGADSLTGGAGVDTFRYVAAVALAGDAANAGVANVDRITDFVAGTDKFSFAVGADEYLTGLNLTAATVFALNTAQTIATAADVTAVFAGITAITASSNAIVQGAVITVSAGAAAGTYLYVNDNTGAVAAAEDQLINITGITGTLAATDFLFA